LIDKSILIVMRYLQTSLAAFSCVAAALGLIFVSATQAAMPPDYKGIPYVDAVHQFAPQAIPGRIECVYFDSGGEGVAFHSDGTNHGNHDFNLAEHRRHAVFTSASSGEMKP
jgi:hypothetical protein